MQLISTNPSKNYKVLGKVTISTKEDIQKAVASAHDAFASWSMLPLEERIIKVQSLIPLFEKEAKNLAEIMTKETGRPILSSQGIIDFGISYLREYLTTATQYLSPQVTYQDEQELHRVFREPWGIIACIVPWNFPFMDFIWQCGQALLAGNTVVFKGSEENPLCSKKLEEIISQSMLPKGVVNIIYGDGKIGDALVHENINMICCTGSVKTGQYLYQVAAKKFIPILLELGGSAPGIVFEDADIEKVINSIYEMRFVNCGQSCDALKRLIVHESKFETIIEKLKKIIATKKIGDPMYESTEIGSLVAKRQLQLLEEQVQDAIGKGAEIIIGGKQPENLKGAYYLPTILTKITKDMRVWQEEVFGPVLPVVSFTTEEEAIALANDTQYGLGAYIYTDNKERFERVARQVQSGEIAQNNISYFKPCNPFGGYKKSGLGREHGEFGFHDVTQVKLLVQEK